MTLKSLLHELYRYNSYTVPGITTFLPYREYIEYNYTYITKLVNKCLHPLTPSIITQNSTFRLINGLYVSQYNSGISITQKE